MASLLTTLTSFAEPFFLSSRSWKGSSVLLLGIPTAVVASLSYFIFCAPSDDKAAPIAPISALRVAYSLRAPNAPRWILNVKQNMVNNARVFCLRIPIPPLFRFYIVSDPILCREILMDPNGDKPNALYKGFRRVSKRIGLFTATRTSPNESYVRSVRKSLLTTMHKSQIQRMQKVTDGIVDRWMNEEFRAKAAEQGTNSIVFDPAREVLWITFSVILQAAFEYTPTFKEFECYLESQKKIDKGAVASQFDIGYWLACRLGISKQFKEIQEGGENNKRLARKLIAEYRKNVANRSDDPTILHILINQPEILKLNDEADTQLVCEVLIWLFAGHDTTGFSVSHSLIFLAMHPECQDKLRKEVIQSEESADDAVNNRSTSYLSCVVRETWRMAPVAALGGARSTGRAFTHEATGVVIPKGAICVMPQYLYARDAEIFPDPEVFKPERWESPTSLMEKSYFPFSLGGRNCPGQGLALAEIYSTIPKIIRNYRLELHTEGYVSSSLTYSLLGYKLKATRL